MISTEMQKFIDQKQKDMDDMQQLPPYLYENNRGVIKIIPAKLGQTILANDKYVSIQSGDDLTLYRYNNNTGLWEKMTLNKLRKAIGTMVVDYWTNKEVLDTAKYILDIAPVMDASDTIDNVDPYKVHFLNGVFDLRTGEMKPHSPDNYLFHGRKYAIDTTDGATPLTDKWLEESLRDAKPFIMEYIGFCFYRSYENLQKFAILLSEGGDGKSTFFNWLRDLVGPENTSTVRLSDLTNPDSRFTIARLQYKNLNYYADIGGNSIKEPALIKGITGNDAMDAENKGENAKTIRPYAKQFYGANQLPSFKDTSNGFGRRPCIVAFHSIPDFQERYDKEALYAEQPAFVYKCLQEFRKVLERGYFSETEEMDKLRKEWLGDNNVVQEFLDEYCILGPELYTKKVYLYDAYKRYCFANGYKALSNQKFKRELGRFNVYDAPKLVNGKTIRAYNGVRLKPEADTDLEIMRLE